MRDPLLELALSGDASAFDGLTGPLRRGLVLHCYRMLGSMSEAEDVVQDALLRAWRGLAAFEGRASFRNWLYKIATNSSLNALTGRRPRALSVTAEPSDPAEPLPPQLDESYWLEPVPDSLLQEPVNPEASYSLHESVSLAFLAALQRLPASQRAVLILRDVVGFPATEVAQLLELGVASVNSLLQRARETVDREYREPLRKLRRPTDGERDSLLRRYIDAWVRGDVASLVALLKVDAAVTMPPYPTLFLGAAAGDFLSRGVLVGDIGGFALTPTTVNGEPAVAAWARKPDGSFAWSALHVLTFDGDRIARIVAFMGPQQALRFWQQPGGSISATATGMPASFGVTPQR